ncbi:ATP phosphoribosyltransferase [Ferroglobus placidus DSM 10642]|uniref:ATP phosphoribosyltransferase n=1 Tax=Ferroglobus placidus (strain DSM 10642 / AEDII12DO) TaxID=589924 RepID=D3RWI7_FERPA|nr:ATP phosphoribosyltransferase [Ferroglobus placidus]ADC64850.1 ATP phosphoribosyltransferase [Ferroglobus placidus DSM 10642]
MIIAVPNKGRLSSPAMEMLREAGIKVESEDRKLIANTNNENIKILFARARDIPEYVYMNAAQAGITGYDIVVESGFDVDVALKLGFGKAKLVVAAPRDSGIKSLRDLEGKRVATEFENIAKKFFSEKGVNVEIIKVSGACENAPAIGVADAILDLTSTGTTLRMNGLEVVEEVLETEAVLIVNKKEKENFHVKALITALQSVINARGMVYLMMNVHESRLEEVKKVAPGLKGPTIMKVDADGMMAVHVVIHEDRLLEVVEELKRIGAKDILILPIQRLIY